MHNQFMPQTAQIQLAGFLSKYTPEIARLTTGVLAALRTQLPPSVELVYENYNALVIGFGPTERPSEAVLSVAVYPRWVSLFFLQAKNLTDPKRILLGKGTIARHVRLDTPGKLNDPDVRSLIAEA